jgi:hypothetical protein
MTLHASPQQMWHHPCLGVSCALFHKYLPPFLMLQACQHLHCAEVAGYTDISVYQIAQGEADDKEAILGHTSAFSSRS